MNIQALIYDGFDELDVIGVYEPLKMAGFSVELMSLRQQSTVIAAHDLRIFADGVLDLANKPDILIVPGGGWLNGAEHGAWAEAKKGEILNTLKMFFEAGIILAAVCTGSLLLGKAGLLKGRPATTNHSAIEELQTTGAKVMSARVVDDGEIITAGGVTSSLDLGLYLIKRFASAEKAIAVSKQLEFEPRGPIWQRKEI
jgi:putative intracellular protease/amidase